MLWQGKIPLIIPESQDLGMVPVTPHLSHLGAVTGPQSDSQSRNGANPASALIRSPWGVSPFQLRPNEGPTWAA